MSAVKQLVIKETDVIRPDINFEQFKYLAESFLLICLLTSFAYLQSSGLYWGVAALSDRFAHTEIKVSFFVDKLDHRVVLPVEKKKQLENTFFESVTCSHAHALSEGEKIFFREKSKNSDMRLRCTFIGKSGYLQEIKNTSNKDNVDERMFIEQYLLPDLDAVKKKKYRLSNIHYKHESFFPYTKIPIRAAETVFRCMVGYGVCIFLIIYVGYKFSEEKINIKHGLKDLVTFLLVFTAPLFILSLQLKIRSLLGLGGSSEQDLNATDYLVNAFGLSLVTPLIEEMFYRAWMITVLSKRFKPTLCVVISSLIFMWTHDYNFISSIFILVSGLCYGLIWVRTKSLVLCVIPHALHNSILTFISYLKENYY